MQNLNCIIVDDEPIARTILIDYCSYMPVLNVVAVCGNAFEAREILLNQKIDLIFLDINMPVLDGISFLGTIKNPPQVIFTTAYKNHALTAFDLDACDYLVKPFSLDRFIQAVDKASRHFVPVQAPLSSGIEYILVKTENRIHNVKTDEILFAEAKGNYTHIFFDDQVLKPKLALSGLEKLLPPTSFFRVHRSFIINKTKIKHIEGNRIFINNYEIPIGSNFKEGFMAILNLPGQ